VRAAGATSSRDIAADLNLQGHVRLRADMTSGPPLGLRGYSSAMRSEADAGERNICSRRWRAIAGARCRARARLREVPISPSVRFCTLEPEQFLTSHVIYSGRKIAKGNCSGRQTDHAPARERHGRCLSRHDRCRLIHLSRNGAHSRVHVKGSFMCALSPQPQRGSCVQPRSRMDM
jgi:hypothetical protein